MSGFIYCVWCVGLTGELSVAAVSQLASWMLENPSIESDEGTIQDRPTRPWSMGSSSNHLARSEQLNRLEVNRFDK